MRRSRDEKAQSRERIVEVAATSIRERGLDAPGVAEIMRSAGMTHGGFYKHFGSRDELIVAAVERATVEGDERVGELIARADDPLAAFVDWYLSREHIENPGAGCALAALSSEIPRSVEGVRAAYEAQVKRYLATLETLLGSARRARVALATLIGAVNLARALDEPALSDAIVDDVRAALHGAASE